LDYCSKRHFEPYHLLLMDKSFFRMMIKCGTSFEQKIQFFLLFGKCSIYVNYIPVLLNLKALRNELLA
jgi:hypothetical protein